MEKYYINGWKESKSYFYDILKCSGATITDKEKLLNGETIELEGNTFRIENINE
jgi:hypothetical protein